MRITRSSVRLVLILSVILALVVPLGVFAYSHAQKAHAQIITDTCHGYYQHCLRFDKNWTWDTDLYAPGDGPGNLVQMRYTLSGYIGYSADVAFMGGNEYSNIHILDADMNATMYDCTNALFVTCYTGLALINPDVTTMNMTQKWTGYPICSTQGSLSFSVGPPWITLNLADSCSQQELDQKTTEGECGSHVSGCVQDNTNHPAHVSDWHAPHLNPSLTPCLGVNIESDIVEYYPSDNKNHVASFASTSTRQVCLPAP
jgi:hypothetical protein